LVCWFVAGLRQPKKVHDALLNGTTNYAISSGTSWAIFFAGEDQQQTNQPNDKAGV